MRVAALLPILLISIAGIASPSRAEPPAPLAERCNAIPWEIEMGASDLYPAPLRAIQRELEHAGPAVVHDVETGLEESLNLRRIAPRVVAQHPSDRCRSILLRLLDDPDDLTAEAAAFALGTVGGVEVLDALRRAADGSRPMVTHNALGSLISLGAADRAELEARARLEDPEPYVRATAVQLLAEVRGPGSIDRAHAALRALLSVEQDEQVKGYALQALRILEARRG